MTKVYKVYIAGKLNDMACDYIKNMHRMMRTAEEVRKAGFSVYIPCIDILMGLKMGNWEYKDYFENSQPWLEAADAVFLVPGWGTSSGTAREIARAREKGIPVFDSIIKLLGWRYIQENKKKKGKNVRQTRTRPIRKA